MTGCDPGPPSSSAPTDPPEITVEYCDVNENAGAYSRNTRSIVMLKTGGKGVAKRQNLSRLMRAPGKSCKSSADPDGATEITVIGLEFPGGEIKLAGFGRVGNDGNLYKVLPDNSPPLNVTVKTPRDFYTFNVEPTKHKLYVFANNTALSPDRRVAGAEFCVGQKLVFAPVFGPPVSGIQSQNTTWFLPPKYVNHWTVNSAGCTIYDTDAAQLLQEQTPAWYRFWGRQSCQCLPRFGF